MKSKIINILRDIKKLIINNGLSAKYNLWSIGDKNIERDVDVIFPDGLISINSSSKIQVTDFGERNRAKIVTYAADLINKYSIVDGDVFLGRDSNYLLFRNGSLSIQSTNLDININELNIDCEDININVTNAITINNVPLTFVGDKMLINGKEIAVVGGDINPSTNKISVSGQ